VSAPTVKPTAADFELHRRECPDCHKEIMWAKTNASGRKEWMPLDAEPIRSGNVLAYPAPDRPRVLVCDVLGRGPRAGLMFDDGWPIFIHHRLSCPYADRWARQNKSMRPGPAGTRIERPEFAEADQTEGLFDA
jgi:hypothetical protein